MNTPWMATSGPCDICGSHVDYCDGDECDSCGKWTCYSCGTHIGKEWLCPDCAEARQLEEEGEEEDNLCMPPQAPDAMLHRDWYHKQEALREYKAQLAEEARGK